MTQDDEQPVAANHHIQHQYPQNIRFCGLCGAEMRLREVLPDRRRYKVCVSCGFVNFPGPKLVAAALVVDAGRVLLLRRGLMPRIGYWTFPGGYVEIDETADQGAIRETWEEVGMHVTLGALIGLFSDPADPIAAVAVYLAKPGAEAPALSEEATEVRYFAPDQIPWADLAFPTTDAALKTWLGLARQPPR